MSFSPDVKTLELASAGDRVALDALLRGVMPDVERHLRRFSLTDEDRRDLLQETLIRVVRRLDSFRGNARFSTWLYRVTANEALMLVRARRRRGDRVVGGLEPEELDTLQDAPQAEDEPEILLDDAQRDAMVRVALDRLPDHYREVIVAHYHQELGLQEIAERLGEHESAIRSRLHRACARLRSLLARPDFGVVAGV